MRKIFCYGHITSKKIKLLLECPVVIKEMPFSTTGCVPKSLSMTLSRVWRCTAIMNGVFVIALWLSEQFFL